MSRDSGDDRWQDADELTPEEQERAREQIRRHQRDRAGEAAMRQLAKVSAEEIEAFAEQLRRGLRRRAKAEGGE